MHFLIVTHVPHKLVGTAWYAYEPYVREMNLWLKYVDEVTIVAPQINEPPGTIDAAYNHGHIRLKRIPAIAFTNVWRVLNALILMPTILFTIYKACKRADHIHLRCPGNIGLLGCLVQLCFPKKIKTAKYAGNWDPEAKQPLSYRFQKRLLGHTGWTKRLTALVYGNWPNTSKNIKSFFTATYTNEERVVPLVRDYTTNLHFVFVGSLSVGKRPLYAIQMVEAMHQNGYAVYLDVFGDGLLRESLIQYIATHSLSEIVTLHGNQSKEVIKERFKTAHFVILPSQSEGWPKALAEGMFFGVIPIATAVSCVPYMLDGGTRGILIDGNLDRDLNIIEKHLENESRLHKMSRAAATWSQQYTLDVFETEIAKLIQCS